MGQVMPFDAIEYIHKLKDAGVPEKQAETHARVLSEVIESNLATKQDIKELELKINAQLILHKWMLGVVLAGILSLVLKAFFLS